MGETEPAIATRARLEAVGVELWLVDLAASASALEDAEAAAARLSSDDVARIGALGGEMRRERRLAHIALRLALERACGARVRGMALARTSTGRPSLTGWPGGFSLSHVSGLALIGLAAPAPIGVDLERRRALDLSEARRAEILAAGRALSPAAEPSGDPGMALLQAWVRIEAAAKARGSGLGPLLESLGIGRGRAERGVAPTPPADLAVHDLALGADLAAAVALHPSQRVPSVMPFPVTAEDVAAFVS